MGDMLRIHLTPGDVTRLSFGPAPTLELGASALTLLRPTGRPGTDRWRRRTLPRLPRAAWPLLDLVAGADRVPNVLLSGCDIAADPNAAADLVAACRAYEDACLTPMRDALRSNVDTELARVGHRLLSEGAGAALAGLAPNIDFDGRTLTVDEDYGDTDIDVELAGRGLRLIPTFFWQRPGFTDELDGPAVLVYPIARPWAPLQSGVETVALEKLLGRNRARVLRAAASGGGTGELAHTIGISAASVSEHLGVLRDAGFVVTRRTGRSVRHHLTPLGAAALLPE